MQCQEGMDIPLDLKLFMSGTAKVYKCDQCPSSYSDKAYFELHKQSHQKDTNIQIITMNQQPAPAHQQVTPQQVDQLTAYKRAYSGEPQQVCYVQYQVPVSNARAVQMAVVSSGPQQQVNMPTFTTPTYVTTTIPTTVLATPITQPQQIQQQEQPEHHQPQAQSQPQQQQQQQQQQQSQQQQQQQQPQQAVVRQRQVVDRKDRPYKCDQCTASFIDPTELSDHKKKHSGDGPFTCEDCHFTFMYKSHFRSHKTRCQKKRAMMPHPPKPFISPGPLKRQFPTNQSHTTQHQRSNSRTSNKTTPVHHAKQNQNSAPFNPANPTFKRQKKDMRADRPFECNECDASFQNMQDLQTHKAKHTGEGPFKCEECRFVFLYRKLYDAHRRRCEKKRKENQMIVNQAQQQQQHHEQQQQQAQAQHQPHQTHAQPQHVQVQVRPVVTAPTGSGASVAIATPVQVQQAIPHPHQQQQATTVIDMRGQVQVQQPTLIEQVIHAAPGRVTEIKYDMVPTTVEMDQIMNLIKVKGPQQ